MHSIEAYRAHLEQGGFDDEFSLIHSSAGVQESRERMRNLLSCMLENFAPAELCFASAPGRTEMGGNHTDHNHGHVLAAAVNLDCLAAFSKSQNNVVTILSEGYNPIKIDISDTKPRKDEYETSAAIVRGVADGFRKLGLNIGGFNACVHSTIPAGAGLSSSAAFEVLIGRILSYLFNESKVGPLEIASVAKQAENIHFNKPCGFMDQMASSYEGILSIDFTAPTNPGVTRVEPEFKTASCADGFYGTGYHLCVIDTGGSHADLTPDYAAIPVEMFEAARSCGQNQAKGLTLNRILDNIDDIREKSGDRAVLRLFHFIGEDERAVNQAKALHDGNMAEFLRLVSESGHSSRELLQNCYSPATPKRQPIPLALTLTEQILGSHGVGRVHGGGFAGTIQVYVHESDFKRYRHSMEKVFGEDSVIELSIRQPGHEFLTIPQTGRNHNMGHMTLKDLASKLGISASTVSRALHDHPDISDKTKEVVMAAAEKYGYQPNPIAQSLKKQSSKVIGVIVPEIRHNFFATVISGIEEVAYNAGYIIMVCQSNETLQREIMTTKALAANRVAGVLMAISLETTNYDHMRALMRQNIPLVQYDRVVDELDTGKVVIDDFRASYKMTSHLIDRGYKRIGFLAGREGISMNRLRFNGYLQALKNHGAPFYPELNLNIGGCRGSNGRAGAEKYMKMENPPDAVLCINDPVAVGAFCRFREAGWRIPEDVALAGFSGSPESALIDPALTSVGQPAFEMGKTAATLLLKQLKDKDNFRPETITLETELLIRGSSYKEDV